MTTEALRAAFEADAGPMGFDLRRQSIAVPEPWAEYVDPSTGHRWAGWQAAIVAERERIERITREWWDEIRKGETP